MEGKIHQLFVCTVIHCIISSTTEYGLEDLKKKSFVDSSLLFSLWLPLKIFFALSFVSVVLPTINGCKKEKKKP